ncbi:endonuclease/exonuclease/phosphatase family protein [Sphingomonas suaedae]|uniref:Endonuclease/exonuclease/phosphatase family protein n=1 Tax=Sphingomonas suaedae TaxID=2599297 RepID=A0A518RGL9_9SPHN|nr:endonuclease/exonuclease/phosphatase family protein [Sphingomonas suaedae]QDX26559.1 endonuclease/exonuclease/phosphatase family protein [Sphingomonas suaedae]
MNRRKMLAGIAVTGLGPGVARGVARPHLRVMSFNVRLPMDSDGPNRWDARRDLFVETIRSAAPDIIGTQELWKIQGEWIMAKLPGFAWFGVGRRGGDSDEHMGVFYRSDRLRVIERGDFWLSDTPTQPGSISWGHPHPRMATWGLFETVPEGERFWFINTHFPHRPESEAARQKAATQIAAWVAARPSGDPVVLTGDFNTIPDSVPHRILSATLADAWLTAAERAGSEGTSHGFSGVARRRIDWIMARGLEPVRVRTIDRGEDGLWPSDHFPVVAEYRWP